VADNGRRDLFVPRRDSERFRGLLVGAFGLEDRGGLAGFTHS
jgi:hypothetical protein